MKKRNFSAGLCCKVISFFVIAFCGTFLNAQNNLPERNISIDACNKPVIQILDEITLQTGYYFTYDASLIQGKTRRDFYIEDLELKCALDSLLHIDGLVYILIDKNIVIRKRNTVRPEPDVMLTDHAIVKGTVVNGKNGKTLPYATIGLLGTNLGAITNQTGEFSFKIPVEVSDPLLIVSFIGYKNRYFPVTYPINGPVRIELEQDLVSLQEVIIRYQDPVYLVQEAINRIPENYLNDHSRMTAFYRESVSRNEHCVILSEAILDVAKGPYDNINASDRVRIFKGRKISDLTVEDTIMLKIKSGIYTSLNLDIIKNPPDFLSENFTDLYILDFSDIISYSDNLVYVIHFSPKSNIRKTLFTGSLYIDINDLAIVAADFQFDPEKIQTEQGLFVVSKGRNIRVRPLKTKYHVEYRKLNGSYHVSQVRAFVELKLRKRRKWIGARYSIQIDMAVTNVIPGERLRIDPAERVRPNIVMSDETFEYDPGFWGIYNIIEPEASLEEALKNIEKCMQEYMGQPVRLIQ